MTGNQDSGGGHEAAEVKCDTRGRHGMLLFGTDPLYLSHLPMHACAHDVQVLLEVKLGEAVNRALRADRMLTTGALCAPVVGGVRIDVRRVMRFRELRAGAKAQPGQELRYLCFGQAEQLYFVHEPRARPRFDQVLAVRLVPGTVRTATGAALDEDVRAFRFPEVQQVGVGRDDLPQHRLVAGEIVTAWFDLTPSLTGVRGFTVRVEIQRELYLEAEAA